VIFLVGLIKRVRKNQVYGLLGLALFAIVAGGIVYSAVEAVSLGTGLYWAVTTATTVGYGDVTPHNAAGRVVAVVEMLTAIPLFAGVFAAITASAASLKLRRLLELDRHLPTPGYVAIYGGHAIVPRVARDLVAAGKRVVVVATDASSGALPDGVHVVSGDPTSEDVIRRSEPGKAERALVATSDEGDALVTAVLLRHIAPGLPVTAIVHSAHVAQALGDLGVEQALSAEELIGHLVAKSLEAPHASALVTSLLGTESFVLNEVDADLSATGKSLAELRAASADLVLGVVHDGAVDLGVDESRTVGAGDRLLVLTRTAQRRATSS
jgi:voltage-gated potassium channel